MLRLIAQRVPKLLKQIRPDIQACHEDIGDLHVVAGRYGTRAGQAASPAEFWGEIIETCLDAREAGCEDLRGGVVEAVCLCDAPGLKYGVEVDETRDVVYGVAVPGGYFCAWGWV